MKTKEWLINKREEFNITQKELANAIGLSEYSIQNIEQGRRIGSEDTWNKIEEYFKYKENVKNGLINSNSMYRIKINENITTRAMNNLFYQIEIYDEKGNLIRTIQYQRNCIARMLHESPIFDFFKKADDQFINSLQCDEYCNKLEQVIKMLEKIFKIY